MVKVKVKENQEVKNYKEEDEKLRIINRN